MPLPKTDVIWRNGEFIKWEDATTHILSHAIHYGTSWFEGIRAYETKKGVAVLRLREHMSRLGQSLKIYHSTLPFTTDELCDATIELLKRNNLKSCYIRPIVFRGYNELGVYPLNCPLEVAIAAWEWGKYLGASALEEGVEVCVSSWNRIAPNTLPTISKAGGNYMNAQLIRIEANNNGYDEGIALSTNGYVSEGSGENIFLVHDNKLYTTPMSASILPGITRNSVVRIAAELGIDVVETQIPRAMLYTCDELFFTGTAVEITPVRTVDRIPVGEGTVGPITKQIQDRFFGILTTGDDPFDWLTFVD